MRNRKLGTLIATGALILPVQAQAQEEFSLNWHTIDCGGGQSTAEEWLVVATIAQPDAGLLVGPESVESFSIMGGFWIDEPALCYANCDASTGTPMLTANDFTCFIAAYATERNYANCDGSSGEPLLTSNDFLCFINAYANGCS